jgi:hypothetical protein
MNASGVPDFAEHAAGNDALDLVTARRILRTRKLPIRREPRRQRLSLSAFERRVFEKKRAWMR